MYCIRLGDTSDHLRASLSKIQLEDRWWWYIYNYVSGSTTAFNLTLSSDDKVTSETCFNSLIESSTGVSDISPVAADSSNRKFFGDKEGNLYFGFKSDAFLDLNDGIKKVDLNGLPISLTLRIDYRQYEKFHLKIAIFKKYENTSELIAIADSDSAFSGSEFQYTISSFEGINESQNLNLSQLKR